MSTPVGAGPGSWRRFRPSSQRRRTDAGKLDLLLALRPRAPRHLDGELLRYADSLGIDTWDDEGAKIGVRAAFWSAVAEGKPKGVLT